jgi:hypothetical protein
MRWISVLGRFSLARPIAEIRVRASLVRRYEPCGRMARTTRRRGRGRALALVPKAVVRPPDLADEESQRTLDAAADVVADALGEQMALEYFVRVTGTEVP